MKKSVLIILIVVLAIILLGSFLYYSGMTGFVVSTPSTTITRSLQYTAMTANITKLTVRLAVRSTDSALGISESLPAGFSVVSVNGGGVIKDNAVEWLFVPGKTASITYQISAKSMVRNVSFSGMWYSQNASGNIIGKTSISR
jgi:hypothetical protein